MAIFSNVNVGTAPNDGTGDSLRTSFTKVNENFQDLLSIWPNISQNELVANITSSYISSFNLVEAVTLSGSVLTSDTGNINVTTSNVNISSGNLSVSGTITTAGNLVSQNVSGNISGNTATFTGNITTLTTLGNIEGAYGTFSGNVTVNTLIGNLSGSSVTVTGNINGTSSNLISVNHIVRSPVGNNINTPINGGSDTYNFVLNPTDNVGATAAFTINTGTDVTGTVTGTITAGLERTYIIFNPGPTQSNLILPFLPNRTNLNTNTVAISGNTTAFVIIRTINSDIANVFVQVANI